MIQAMAQGTFVIGIDAGGTHTRVACVDLDGRRLSSATGGGGSPTHNDDAEENVRSTITRALDGADLDPARASALVAGMAGFNRTGSNQGLGHNHRFAHFVAIDGLTCEKLLVNDAVVAHRGALSGRAGIVVVAGTGSMILAIDEHGVETESGQLEHYAGAARHLVHDVVQRILIEDGDPADPLHAAALEHFGADDAHGLRQAVLRRSAGNRNDTKRSYGDFAPQVTALADESALADVALRHLAERTARGVQLLAPLMAADPAPVACTGSMARDLSFRTRLEHALTSGPWRAVELVPPRLDPLGGASLLALEMVGIDPDDSILQNLSPALASADA
ncbi:BadF/BadG/BcrA/BcrD ATPase family protein [Brachybacterium sp. FME24]|uniref:BadF/BadG/BcrA/BcrD ATPase family protein n=1 Tax=Brachybacterium sp. FME24 TaxID=2742605 RepID=UPI001865C18C|nr:BadF/BadG/BcrA/BcrD ATPase family protein [Brachybacterium sp. FME24]